MVMLSQNIWCKKNSQLNFPVLDIKQVFLALLSSEYLT